MKGSFVSNSSRRTDTKRDTNTEVSVEEISLKGLPPINLGALFMPPIWGPAHGIWITDFVLSCVASFRQSVLWGI